MGAVKRAAVTPDTAALRKYLPVDVRNAKAFLLWRFEDGRKVPYYANGKRRHGENGSKTDRAALVTFTDAVAAYKGGEWSGIGIALLPELNLSALDFDDCLGSDGTVSGPAGEFMKLTYSEASPSGAGVRALVSGSIPDAKSTDGKVQVFSSRGYVTLTGTRINGAEIATLTPTMRARLTALTKHNSLNVDFSPQSIADGTRDDTLTSLAGSMRRRGMSHEAIEAALLVENEQRCDPPLPQDDVRKIARSVARYEPASRGGGNAAGVPVPISEAAFTKTYRGPVWVVERIIAKGYVYALTALWGHGKTAILLSLATLVAAGRDLVIEGGEIPRVPQRARVLYLCGENPDDVRGRQIATRRHLGLDMAEDSGSIDFTERPWNLADPEALRAFLANLEAAGKAYDLLIIDTGPAHSQLEDENDNEAMKRLAQSARQLTTAPGGPAVIMAMHPAKSATRDNMQPRGGGAFSAEIDGELCAWKYDLGVVGFFHRAKLRGPGFQEFTWRLAKVSLPEYPDNWGAPADCVVAEIGTIRLAEKSTDKAAKALVRVIEAIDTAGGKEFKSKLINALSGKRTDRFAVIDVMVKRGWLEPVDGKLTVTSAGRTAASDGDAYKGPSPSSPDGACKRAPVK